MNEQQQALQELEIYGFTILENVLDTETAEYMRETLKRCERDHGTESGHRGSASHVANLPVMDRVFHQTIDHPRVLPLLEHFLQPSLILGSLNSRIVRPGDGYQGLHSDIPAYMLNMDTPVMMNTVWMLDDFSLDNGATRLIPGSHRKPGKIDDYVEDRMVDHPDQIHLQGPAGSVAVFNGSVWHSSYTNNSGQLRRTLHCAFIAREHGQQTNQREYLRPATAERLSPLARYMLDID